MNFPKIRIFTILLLIFASTFVLGQNKKIISSEIRWKAYKTLKTESLSHYGTVKLLSGNLTFNGDQLAGGTFIMDMNSIDAEDMKGDPKLKKMLENHLKSDDFFDTARFPKAVFQIKTVKKLNSAADNYMISGSLTIKGITKTISFPAKMIQNNGFYIITSAQFSFNRKHFGLRYNIFEDMLISNDVEMNVVLKAQ